MFSLAVLGVMLGSFELQGSFTPLVFLSHQEQSGSIYVINAQKKKKKKSKHKKKHKKRRGKKKGYSAKNIDELLKNDKSKCNRLNCSSNLQIAKSCLKTKEARRKEKKCFRAFCFYGCNDHDYETNADVRNFCNATCSSRKYGTKLHP
ncbi:MAG: hypothetical protein FJX71_03940 [Alphaproteobacteria bacterium]|nr:hypothetical protein [Alphaproteobacteria bacterium]